MVRKMARASRHTPFWGCRYVHIQLYPVDKTDKGVYFTVKRAVDTSALLGPTIRSKSPGSFTKSRLKL